MSYIKKADYIERFGEEAWAREAAKRSEYGKQQYQKHKGRVAERNKQWREERPDYHKQWKEEHPDYDKQWRKEHPDYYRQYSIQRRKTKQGRANQLRSRYIETDKKKGFPADQIIDTNWIIENIFNTPCIYCGESDWRKLGADRIDNTKGHTPDNVVCSCWNCNKERGDKFTPDEFIHYRKLKPTALSLHP